MLLNTAAEASTKKTAIGRAVQDAIARKAEAISERVVQAQRDGELDAAAEPLHVATSVCTMIAGLRTLVKAGLPKEWLRGAARQTTDALFHSVPEAAEPIRRQDKRR
ncbi:MAG: hypothetical protein H0W48_01670 [Methylibium sp.]|nr:hypothetical protein [Methylibium sp.]